MLINFFLEKYCIPLLQAKNKFIVICGIKKKQL